MKTGKVSTSRTRAFARVVKAAVQYAKRDTKRTRQQLAGALSGTFKTSPHMEGVDGGLGEPEDVAWSTRGVESRAVIRAAVEWLHARCINDRAAMMKTDKALKRAIAKRKASERGTK